MLNPQLNQTIRFPQTAKSIRTELKFAVTHFPFPHHSLPSLSLPLQVVSAVRVVSGGFTTLSFVVEGLEEYAGHYVRIQAKNENYIAERVDQRGEKSLDVLACTPDLIVVIDSDTGTLHSQAA